jgi:nitroreductase
MNETIKQLYDRKSVRVFTDREIDENIVTEILVSATMAPTAGNQQLYTILRITDPEIKNALSIYCDNQPFINEGKLLLVFCADSLKWYDAYKYAGAQPRVPGEGDLMLAVNDALIAAQNAVVAAESYGIGSCYIGDIMERYEDIKALLKLPDYVFPAAFIVFGYPTDGQKERKKPERADLRYIVHENTYKHLDKNELYDMLSIRAPGKDTEEYIKAFCARKYNSDFSCEMTRSVKEYIKEYKNEL